MSTIGLSNPSNLRRLAGHTGLAPTKQRNYAIVFSGSVSLSFNRVSESGGHLAPFNSPLASVERFTGSAALGRRVATTFGRCCDLNFGSNSGSQARPRPNDQAGPQKQPGVILS